jgi:hypothetical protein
VAALTVPKEYQSALANLMIADEPAFAELLEAIKGARLSFTSEALAASVTSKIKNLSPEHVESIIELLTGLHFVRSGAGVSLDQFVDDLLEGAQEGDLREAVAKSQDKARQRLTALLSEKTIGFAAKARETERNYERSYCNAEMLTDIRPIFDNGDGSPIAAVLTHTLKISYHQRERLKDVFITLTPDDLDELDGVIEQARMESEQLTAILDKVQIAHPEGDHSLSSAENKTPKMLKENSESSEN